MQRWVLFGTGVFLVAVMKGCPQTEQPSTSLPSKQPTAISNNSQETTIPKDLESSSLKKTDKFNIPVRTPKNTKIGLLLPQILTSSGLQERRHLSFLPADSLLSSSIKNQNSGSHLRNESDPEPPVTHANSSDINPGQEVQKQNNEDKFDQLSSTSLELQNTSKQNLGNDTDVVPSTLQRSESLNLGKISGEQGSSEQCNFPGGSDLAGNNCRYRPANERSNMNIDNTLTRPIYVNPVINYQMPSIRANLRQPTYANPSLNYGTGTVYVQGYVRKDGTYVRPHSRRK